MGNDIEIIGIDNGYGFTKTATAEFSTSLTYWGERKPPLPNQCVMFDNQYYTIGGDRKKVKVDKTEDLDTYILTLAGIAIELKKRGKNTSDIILAVGLPLDRCSGENRVEFEKYFMKNPVVDFEYEDEAFHIEIKKTVVSPQCMSGIIGKLSDKTIACPSVVVDVGSWTLDILPIDKDSNGNPQPQIAKVISLDNGVIRCFNECQKEFRKFTKGMNVPDALILDYLKGNSAALKPKYAAVVDEITKRYVQGIADSLIEEGFNIYTIPCIFMGGGANIVKKYDGEKIFEDSMYIENTRANAIGYEKIVKNAFRQ